MSSEIAIKVENLGKCYQIYEHPRDLMPSPSYIREQQARSDAMLASQCTTTGGLRWCARQLRNLQRDGVALRIAWGHRELRDLPSRPRA